MVINPIPSQLYCLEDKLLEAYSKNDKNLIHGLNSLFNDFFSVNDYELVMNYYSYFAVSNRLINCYGYDPFDVLQFIQRIYEEPYFD